MRRVLLRNVLLVVGVGLLVPAVHPCANAYVMSKSTIYTDAVATVKYSGVSAMSDGRIIVSMDHPSLGQALRIFDVGATSATQVGGTLNTGTGNTLLDVAYLGSAGTIETFYVVRDASSDVFLYHWDPNDQSGTYQGIVSKYNSGTNFPGMDREFEAGPDDLVQCATSYIYQVDGNGDSAVRTNIYGPIGSGTFAGITALGDINEDGDPDYAVVRNVDGAGWFHILTSTGTGYTIGPNYLADSGRLYMGVAYLGDPDGDNLREFVLVSVDSAGGEGGFIEYVETDVPLTAGPVCGDALHPYPVGDLDLDCMVTLSDFCIFAQHWLEDNTP